MEKRTEQKTEEVQEPDEGREVPATEEHLVDGRDIPLETKPASKSQEPKPEPEKYLLTAAVHRVVAVCALCQAKGEGRLLIGRVGPYQFPWLRPPPGWWLLAGFTDFDLEHPLDSKFMFRCPKCLTMPRSTIVDGSPPPRGPHSPRRPRRRGRR